MNRRRALGLLGAVLAALLALTGCGRDINVEPVTQVGTQHAVVFTLMAPGVESAVVSALPRALQGKKVGIRYGTGSPDDIAATVKNGRLIDLVVLPAGPALDRISDELLRAPSLLGTLGSTRYYAGAVTAKGLPIVTFWEGPQGRARLRKAGLH